MPGRYSNRQLDEYRTELRRNRSNPANARRPICMNCTGRPATELKCAQCDITKGLDAFTKAQRRDPDNAVCKLSPFQSQITDTDLLKRCKDCVQDNVDELPNAEDRLAELKIRDETERGGSKVSDVSLLYVYSAESPIARISILHNRFSAWLRQRWISSWYLSERIRQPSPGPRRWRLDSKGHRQRHQLR